MEIIKFFANNIPAIVWGRKSNKVYIHVHGKMSCKENAEDFAKIAEDKGYQTISFDLPEHGQRVGENYACNIWNGMDDLAKISDFAFLHWNEVSLFACSIGAYFSLNTYADKKFTNCLFQSPIVDMNYLIEQMFSWFHVTEKRLYDEKEIATPIDLLSWDYYMYVREHPITEWNIPTKILYGGNDNLQSLDVIEKFSKLHDCILTISHDSEHPFMESEDIKIVNIWLKESILEVRSEDYL